MQKRFKAFIDGNNLMLDDQVFPIDLTKASANLAQLKITVADYNRKLNKRSEATDNV